MDLAIGLGINFQRPSVSGAFDYDIPGAGLVLDLNARVSSSIILNAGKVQSWIDQKFGVVFSQATATNRPLVSGEAIQFSGNEWLDSTTIVAAHNITGPLSIFTVGFKTDNTDPSNSMIIYRSTGANGYQFGHSSGPAGEASFAVFGKHDQSSDVVAWENGVRTIVGTRFTSGSNQYEKNGAQLGFTKSAPGFPNPVNTVTRIGRATSAASAWDGNIERILMYNTKIDGANLTAIRAALSADYGI